MDTPFVCLYQPKHQRVILSCFLQLTGTVVGFAPLKWLAIHFQIISQNTYYVIQYSSFLSLLLICILQTSSKLLYWYKNYGYLTGIEPA